MFGKLVRQNMRRSLKDYLIYFVTITIAVSLMFAFHSLVFSDDILSLSSEMKNFRLTVFLLSGVMVFLLGWLIHYTMKFMLEKRSKEWGTYVLLGMDKKQVIRLFRWENLWIGSFAFAVGLAIGTLLFQILSLIILNVFDTVYVIKLSFSWSALGVTLLFFILIFWIALVRVARKLKKMSIYQLIYADKINETKKWRGLPSHVLLFLLSILLLGSGIFYFYLLFLDTSQLSFSRFVFALFLIIGGLYGTYLYFTALWNRYYEQHPNRKYRSFERLFLFRALSSKINTMRWTVANLAFLFTLTLTSIALGVTLNGTFESQANQLAPYDVLVSNSDSRYIDYVHQNRTVLSELTYPVYTSAREDDTKFYKSLQNDTYSVDWLGQDFYLRLSDYNKLRAMQSLQPITLGPEEYSAHSLFIYRPTIEDFARKHATVTIGGQRLSYKDTMTEPFSQHGINGYYYFIVVPDQVAEALLVVRTNYVANVKEPTDEAFYRELCRYITPSIDSESNIQYINLGNVRVRGQLLAETRTYFTIISFAVFYLGLVFICAAATILSLQQLSDSNKYQYRYRLLYQLGVSKSKIDRLIGKQLLWYFSFPLILPIFVSALLVLSFFETMKIFFSNSFVIYQYLGLSFSFFFLIYLVYFVITYFCYRRNIHQALL